MLAEHGVEDFGQGAGVLASTGAVGEARIGQQVAPIDGGEKGFGLALLVEQGENEPATVGAAIVIGQRVGREIAMRPIATSAPAVWLPVAFITGGYQGGRYLAAFAGAFAAQSPMAIAAINDTPVGWSPMPGRERVGVASGAGRTRSSIRCAPIARSIKASSVGLRPGLAIGGQRGVNQPAVGGAKSACVSPSLRRAGPGRLVTKTSRLSPSG